MTVRDSLGVPQEPDTIDTLECAHCGATYFLEDEEQSQVMCPACAERLSGEAPFAFTIERDREGRWYTTCWEDGRPVERREERHSYPELILAVLGALSAEGTAAEYKQLRDLAPPPSDAVQDALRKLHD